MKDTTKPDYDRFGYALAMRVMQSDLYADLDDRERAECDALVNAVLRPAPSIAGKPHKELVERLRMMEREMLDAMDCSGSKLDVLKSRAADAFRAAASALDSAARESEKANEGDSASIVDARSQVSGPVERDAEISALRERIRQWEEWADYAQKQYYAATKKDLCSRAL